MNLTNKLSDSTRNIFFICIILFVFFLRYALIQAEKISNDWQDANEKAIEMATGGK